MAGKQIAHIEKRKPDKAKQRNRNVFEDRTLTTSKYVKYFTTIYLMTVFKEPCLVTVVSWLQENSALYFEIEESHLNSENKEEIEASKQTFTRYWIYSHHIYSNVGLFGEMLGNRYVYFTVLDEEKEHVGPRL